MEVTGKMSKNESAVYWRSRAPNSGRAKQKKLCTCLCRLAIQGALPELIYWCLLLPLYFLWPLHVTNFRLQDPQGSKQPALLLLLCKAPHYSDGAKMKKKPLNLLPRLDCHPLYSVLKRIYWSLRV